MCLWYLCCVILSFNKLYCFSLCLHDVFWVLILFFRHFQKLRFSERFVYMVCSEQGVTSKWRSILFVAHIQLKKVFEIFLLHAYGRKNSHFLFACFAPPYACTFYFSACFCACMCVMSWLKLFVCILISFVAHYAEKQPFSFWVFCTAVRMHFLFFGMFLFMHVCHELIKTFCVYFNFVRSILRGEKQENTYFWNRTISATCCGCVFVRVHCVKHGDARK